MSIRSFVDTTTIVGQVLIPAATPVNYTLTPQQSGTTFIATKIATQPINVTLTSPTIAGIKYRIYLANTAATSVLTISTPAVGAVPTASMIGWCTVANGVKILSTGTAALVTSIQFLAAADPSDLIDFVSDGTVWRCEGNSQNNAGFQFVA